MPQRRRPLAPEFLVCSPRQSCQGKRNAYCGQTAGLVAGQHGSEKDFCVNLQIFQKLAAQFKSNAISVKQSAAAFHLAPTRHRRSLSEAETQVQPVDNFIYLQLATVYIN